MHTTADPDPRTDAVDLDLLVLDPRDESAFAGWFEVLHASGQAARPGEPDWLLHEQRQISLDGIGDDPDSACVLLAARSGGETVGAVRLELPRRDNLHLAELVFEVHPAARRRGVARALAVAAEVQACAQGRNTLLTFVDEPPGSEGRSAGRLAGRALGYEVVQTEVRRDIDLPLDPARVEQLERTCRPYAQDYAVRRWQDRCPDDLVDGLAVLMRQMSTDVPKDEMDWREEVWDAARVRRDEALAAAMDRASTGAGVVHTPTGQLVAFTRMGVPRSDRRRAYQWETLVSAAHRGHRLGTLVKLAGLQALADSSPQTAVISTWNAQENGPMIAVNDALGARTNGRLAVLQKVLDR